MKPILKRIFLNLAKGTTIAFTFLALLTGVARTIKAQAIPSQVAIPSEVTNGLFYPRSSELFFEEGTQKLEREIKILNQRQYESPDRLLQISDELLAPQAELIDKEIDLIIINDDNQ